MILLAEAQLLWEATRACAADAAPRALERVMAATHMSTGTVGTSLYTAPARAPQAEEAGMLSAEEKARGKAVYAAALCVGAWVELRQLAHGLEAPAAARRVDELRVRAASVLREWRLFW